MKIYKSPQVEYKIYSNKSQQIPKDRKLPKQIGTDMYNKYLPLKDRKEKIPQSDRIQSDQIS